MEYFSTMENVLWLIWLAVGVAFIVAELMVPGFIMIFFGVGALIAGATAFFDFSLQAQISVFGISSLVLILLLRKVMASTFAGASAEDEEEDTDTAIGSSAEVTQPIVPPHSGRVKFQGSFWSAHSQEPAEKGDVVRIIGRDPKDHNAFIVEKEA